MIDEIINNLQRISDRKCYPEDILDGSIAQEWVDYISELQQENKQLKEQFEKASDYIKDRFDGEVFTHTFDKCNMRELCEILKIKFEED